MMPGERVGRDGEGGKCLQKSKRKLISWGDGHVRNPNKNLGAFVKTQKYTLRISIFLCT